MQSSSCDSAQGREEHLDRTCGPVSWLQTKINPPEKVVCWSFVLLFSERKLTSLPRIAWGAVQDLPKSLRWTSLGALSLASVDHVTKVMRGLTEQSPADDRENEQLFVCHHDPHQGCQACFQGFFAYPCRNRKTLSYPIATLGQC